MTKTNISFLTAKDFESEISQQNRVVLQDLPEALVSAAYERSVANAEARIHFSPSVRVKRASQIANGFRFGNGDDDDAAGYFLLLKAVASRLEEFACALWLLCRNYKKSVLTLEELVDLPHLVSLVGGRENVDPMVGLLVDITHPWARIDRYSDGRISLKIDMGTHFRSNIDTLLHQKSKEGSTTSPSSLSKSAASWSLARESIRCWISSLSSNSKS